MNIFKDRFIDSRVFILISIIAIIIASGILYMFDKKQDKIDADFEKSRAGIKNFVNSATTTINK
ncbi:MAG TPA: hypothetical protein PKL13_02245 [bacterium]|nr:hypothetical protein [bacterium]